MLPEPWLTLCALAIPGAPALAFVLLAGIWLFYRDPGELVVSRITAAAQLTALVGATLCAVSLMLSPTKAIELELGHWYHHGEHHFSMSLWLDTLSVSFAALTAVIAASIGRFSAHYLHREPGFLRFFLMLLLFSSGMSVLVLAGSYDFLFLGWELVGIPSILLVAFYWQRRGPVDGSLRLLITYRLCDVGLLSAAVLMHLSVDTSAYHHIFESQMWPGTPMESAPLNVTGVGLLLLFAAMGKSAIFPLGGWLPRAMEGPSPSSALFYGGLSVHAGVYVVLRGAPIFEGAPAAQVALLGLGLLTAAQGALSRRTATDIKSRLAFATMTQVGLIFAAMGLGLWRWALVHTAGHALLRTWQMLRAPSALADARQIRAGLGAEAALHPAPTKGSAKLWRTSFDRAYVDIALSRWIAEPVEWLSFKLGRLEERWEAWLTQPAARSPRKRFLGFGERHSLAGRVRAKSVGTSHPVEARKQS